MPELTYLVTARVWLDTVSTTVTTTHYMGPNHAKAVGALADAASSYDEPDRLASVALTVIEGEVTPDMLQ